MRTRNLRNCFLIPRFCVLKQFLFQSGQVSVLVVSSVAERIVLIQKIQTKMTNFLKLRQLAKTAESVFGLMSLI